MTQLTKTNIDNIYVTEDARVWDDKRQVWCTVGKNKSTHYWHVSISGRAPVSLHRLMCETFHGMPVGDAKFVGHIDDNKDNNHKDNLKWVTRKQNNATSTKARLANKAEPRLTTEQLEDMFSEYETGNYTLTGITEYMNTKYGRNSLKPTYAQNLRGHCGKKFWESQSLERIARIRAITVSNTCNFTIIKNS